MTSLTHGPRTSLLARHAAQQPLVRALAAPMVEEMMSSLAGIHVTIEQRDAELAQVMAQLALLTQRMSVLEERAQTQVQALTSQLETAKTELASSQETAKALTSKVEVASDRIHVLKRQIYAPRLEKQKKTPDARRGARKRRRRHGGRPSSTRCAR